MPVALHRPCFFLFLRVTDISSVSQIGKKRGGKRANEVTVTSFCEILLLFPVLAAVTSSFVHSGGGAFFSLLSEARGDYGGWVRRCGTGRL